MPPVRFTGVRYRIDPAGFQDSTGDGVGDLEGLLERMDYLVELGVDAVSLPPNTAIPESLRSSLPLTFVEAAGRSALLEIPWSARAIAAWAEEIAEQDQWPILALGTAEMERPATRLGSDATRLAATLLLTLPGIPELYYGDEIGLDGSAASPMQWDSSPGAGFTTGSPRVAIPSSAAFQNVAVQLDEPDSLLNLYRRLLRLRNKLAALHRGTYRGVDVASDDALCFIREAADAPGHYKRIFVALNFGHEPAHVILPGPGRVLLWSDAPGEDTNLVEVLRLDPKEGAIAVLFA